MNQPNYKDILEDLQKAVVGDISTTEEDREKLARDTSLFYVKPEIIVYPRNRDDVSRLLAYASEARKYNVDISVTFRSAGTCMTGGSLTNSIVVDTTKYLTRISEVTDFSATAEPGALYRDFEKKTLLHGWIMPSYPASRDIAGIGGIVSNNSGGEKTLTYGKTEKYVRSLDVVFANGEREWLRPFEGEELEKKMQEETESGRIHREMYALVTENYDLIMKSKPSVSKNSSGYYLWNIFNKETGGLDLTKIVVGSQGTLAAVVSATFSGVIPKTHSRMIVMFIPSTERLGEIILRILKHKPESVESYDDHTFKIAIKFFKDIAIKMGGNMFTLGLQFLPEFWMVLTGGVPKIILMAEFTGDSEDDVNQQVKVAYEDMKSFNMPIKYTSTAWGSKKYWTFRRESFNLLRSRLSGMRTAPTIDDIVVHPQDLPLFLPKLDVIFAKDAYKGLVYTVAGHMGDANFHIIPLVNIHAEGIVDTLHNLMEEVFTLVFEFKGSMSGEHNDGLLRSSYLPKMFSPEMITLFEKTKNIFDPLHVLNPGKKVFADKDFAWKHIDMEEKHVVIKPEPKVVYVDKTHDVVFQEIKIQDGREEKSA
ncbi:MAG: FAD-binding oxidoreductase [Candidatus Pacebacteria bacterium]|nr:FAD-binding oxidoreductase [Candidatus Paceibacterota bacterium]MBP9866567.1 FAD-binding oxidoreductase [Candidatus Paceibacterota bacterium]